DTGSAVYMPYRSIEMWFKEQGAKLESNVLYLHAKDRKYTDSIKEKVKKLGYKGSMKEAMTSMFTEMLDILSTVLAGIAGISLVVSAIMILVVLNISVVERTREIGVLKALGARKKDIRRIFVSESFLLGTFGGMIGTGITFLISVVVNHFTNKK